METQVTQSATEAASALQGVWDSLGLGLVIAAAIGYLYIRLWKGRKSCHACPSSGAGCTSCHVSTDFIGDKD